MDQLISADSHVDLREDDIRRRMSEPARRAFDHAVNEYARRKQERVAVQDQRAGADMWQSLEYTYAAKDRAGHHDPHARLADMDEDGVDAEVIYSELSAFRFFNQLGEHTAEAVRAFNDALWDFASVDPKRLIVSAQIALDDVAAAVREVERCIELGFKSLQVPVFPGEVGCPEYWDPRYDPLWEVCAGSGLPVCLHIGLRTDLDGLISRDPTPQLAVYAAQTVLSTGEAFGMWLTSGVLERHPHLRLVFVEPGIGWIPWYLWNLDDKAERRGYEFPNLSELPSHYFHTNIWTTFFSERFALTDLRHILRADRLLWSTDYPHPTTSWPRSRSMADELFAGIPAEEVHLMTYKNAQKVWSL